MGKSRQDGQRQQRKHEIRKRIKKPGRIARVQVQQAADQGNETEDGGKHGTQQRESKEDEQDQPGLSQKTPQEPGEQDTPAFPWSVDLGRCEGDHQNQENLREAPTHQKLKQGQQEENAAAIFFLHKACRPDNDQESRQHGQDAGDEKAGDDRQGCFSAARPKAVRRANGFDEQGIRSSIALQGFEESMFDA